MRTEDFGTTGEGAAKKKRCTIVRTHGHSIKVFEKAIANSPWGAFEGDTEPRGRARRLRTEDFGSTGEGAAKKKGGTIVKTHGHSIKVFEKAIANSPWGSF